jgi:hypothetical protein
MASEVDLKTGLLLICCIIINFFSFSKSILINGLLLLLNICLLGFYIYIIKNYLTSDDIELQDKGSNMITLILIGASIVNIFCFILIFGILSDDKPKFNPNYYRNYPSYNRNYNPGYNPNYYSNYNRYN